jgi:uncharacterized protein (UPF0335 family)
MHPVDRLASIRKQIEELESEADDIKNDIIEGNVDHSGKEYEATVIKTIRRNITVKRAEKVLSKDLFDQLVRKSNQNSVRLKKISAERVDKTSQDR